MTERERYATAHGEAIRTADGWSWLCELCHRVTHVGIPEDVEDGELRAILDSMDTAHWCWKKGAI